MNVNGDEEKNEIGDADRFTSRVRSPCFIFNVRATRNIVLFSLFSAWKRVMYAFFVVILHFENGEVK